MPFIGNQPALSYTSFAKQDFTTSATTSYTLDHPVTNENEIALFINFVRQEPGTAYTASNVNLNLTSATSASDDMYCVFLGKAVQTVNPPNGSVGLSQLSATGTKDSTTFLRGDNTFATAGGDNTPAFQATFTSDISLTSDTETTVAANSETYDTDSAYNTSNYTFTIPSGEAGKYFFYALAYFENSAVSGTAYCFSRILKASTTVLQGQIDFRNNNGGYDNVVNLQGVIDCAAGDAFTWKVTMNGNTTPKLIDSPGSRWGAFKLIGV